MSLLTTLFGAFMSPRDKLKHELMDAVGKGGIASIRNIKTEKTIWEIHIDNDGFNAINWENQVKSDAYSKSINARPQFDDNGKFTGTLVDAIPVIHSIPFWSTAPDDLIEGVIDDLDRIKIECKRQGDIWREQNRLEQELHDKKVKAKASNKKRVEKKVKNRLRM